MLLPDIELSHFFGSFASSFLYLVSASLFPPFRLLIFIYCSSVCMFFSCIFILSYIFVITCFRSSIKLPSFTFFFYLYILPSPPPFFILIMFLSFIRQFHNWTVNTTNKSLKIIYASFISLPFILIFFIFSF